MTKRIPGRKISRMRLLPVFLSLLCLVGCATKRVDWNTRVGVYHFDRVVREIGPPDKETTLSDGTRVAEWMTRRGASRTTMLSDPYFGITTPVYTTTGPDSFLRLTFDRGGMLQETKRLYR